MTRNFIQKYHFLLVSNDLEKFEQELSSHVLTYFGKNLPLNSCFTDWLVIKLRPMRQLPILQSYLNSDYIESELMIE